MATVTKPMALDETLQATNTKLEAIAQALGGSPIIGNTDISNIADGTLTGAVAEYSTMLQQINENVAPVETTNTASQSYAVGSFLINKDGQLCRVISAISTGGTITIGTNCSVLNLTQELTPKSLTFHAVNGSNHSITVIQIGSLCLITGYVNIPSIGSYSNTVIGYFDCDRKIKGNPFAPCQLYGSYQSIFVGAAYANSRNEIAVTHDGSGSSSSTAIRINLVVALE